MRKPTLQQVLDVYRKKGYTLYLEKEMDLNIFGIRRNVGGRTGQSRQTDAWDDLIGCIWKENGRVHMRLFEATTDPGLQYLTQKFGNGRARGRGGRTAILKPGHYRGMWRRGRHKSYSAFRQKRKAVFYQDRDLDGYLDMGDHVPLEESIIWCNLHSTRPRLLSRRVWNWSAACQVLRRWRDFAWMRRMGDRQIAAGHGNSFSYSLFVATDF